MQNNALQMTQNSGEGEGIEAWRKLLVRYEPRSKQSKVIGMVAILGYDFLK